MARLCGRAHDDRAVAHPVMRLAPSPRRAQLRSEKCVVYLRGAELSHDRQMLNIVIELGETDLAAMLNEPIGANYMRVYWEQMVARLLLLRVARGIAAPIAALSSWARRTNDAAARGRASHSQAPHRAFGSQAGQLHQRAGASAARACSTAARRGSDRRSSRAHTMARARRAN